MEQARTEAADPAVPSNNPVFESGRSAESFTPIPAIPWLQATEADVAGLDFEAPIIGSVSAYTAPVNTLSAGRRLDIVETPPSKFRVRNSNLLMPWGSDRSSLM